MNNLSEAVLPPQDLGIEKAVLGALMQESCPDVIEFLSPSVFYNEEHSFIFNAITELNNKGLVVDILTVSDELKKRKSFDNINIPYYLSECIDCVTNAANIHHHAKIIKELAMRREIINISSEASKLAYDGKCSAQEIIEKTDKLITEMQNGLYQKDDSESINIISRKWLDYWSRKNKTENFNYIKTYISGIDDMIGGFQNGEYVIIGARPGIGKTSFAIQMFWENMQRGIVPGMISIEASKY